MSRGADQRPRLRRGFAAYLAPAAVVLLVAGILWADDGGLLGGVGLAALAQGIGLAVAVLWLALGRNPLDRR